MRVVLATEDGSAGDHGRVTVPLEGQLRAAAGDPQPSREASAASGRDVMIYACGPEPMLEAVTHLATRYSRSSQVSVERVMGCGLGGCYSCVIPVRDAGGGGASLDWSLVQPEVAKFTRVCTIDRAGLGWSDPGPKGASSMRNVEELEALLSNAKI